MKFFKEALGDGNTSLKILPILHSCEAFDFLSILESRQLKPYKCDVFKKDYLYAFYGIPSYRKLIQGSKGNASYFPVCFIMDYDKIPDMSRLHPFDTGAFSKLSNIKEDHFHEKVGITHLELDPSIEEAKKVIKKFYKTNENYVLHKPKLSLDDVSLLNQPAYGYTSLINDKSSTKYDNRVATIELIYSENIELDSSSLLQVIAPKSYLAEDEIKEILTNDFGIIDPIGYRTIKGNPLEYFGAIYDKYLDFTEQNNLI
ncbi:hypothetical protein [uncultured Kordia sp.]|uniref:hypothetical protein n=1 Tax=uncultured Kordia sp. TaxID=507699 RepID=UPI00261830E6|nr:hypothetical protein [uncultured Kordia sp.]